jgi:hypothetical protein
VESVATNGRPRVRVVALNVIYEDDIRHSDRQGLSSNTRKYAELLSPSLDDLNDIHHIDGGSAIADTHTFADPQTGYRMRTKQISGELR